VDSSKSKREEEMKCISCGARFKCSLVFGEICRHDNICRCPVCYLRCFSYCPTSGMYSYDVCSKCYNLTPKGIRVLWVMSRVKGKPV